MSSSNIGQFDHQIRSIAWDTLRSYADAYGESLSKDHVPKLIKNVRKALQKNGDVKLNTNAPKKAAEAIYAHFFYTLLEKRNQALDKAAGDAKKNYHKNLSADQTAEIELRVLNEYAKLASAQKKIDSAIPDWIGYLIVAALYDKRHNSATTREQISSMVSYDPDSGDCFVKIDCEEFSSRLDAWEKGLGKDEDGSDAQDEDDDDGQIENPLADKDAFLMASTITSQAKSTRDGLLGLLERRVLNREDEEYVKIKIDQLNNIERAIRPLRVAVLGCMSAGKSTFLSALLGEDNLLPTGNGAVTKVLAELEYMDENEFVATLSFASVDDIEQLYEQEKSMFHGETEDDEDIAALTALYSLFDNTDEVLSSGGTLNPTPAARLIGTAPLKLRAPTLRGISDLLGNTLKQNEELYNYTLQSIRITGPFEHLPAGVVLIDTPGLDDANQVNSHRTLGELHTFDEVWYANSYDTAMGKDTDQLVIRKLLSLPRGPSTRLHVVATKADEAKDRGPETLKTFQNNIHLSFCRHVLENRGVGDNFLRSTDLVLAKMRQQPVDVQQNVARLEKRVEVNFVAARKDPKVGLEYWRRRLQLLAKESKEKLQKEDIVILQLKNRPDTSGGVHTSNGPRKVSGSWKSAENLFNEAISKVDKKAIIVNLREAWTRIRKSSTIAAIMHKNRAGAFRSHATRQNFDINFNIAEHWILYGGLKPMWEEFMNKMRDITSRAVGCGPQNQQLGSFAADIQSMGKHLFEVEVRDKIRAVLKANNVYRFERDTLPSDEELTDVINMLIENAQQFLVKARARFSLLSTCLLSFQGTANKAIGNILYNKSHIEANKIPPIDFLSTISNKVMSYACITQCCDRCIDMEEFTSGGRCPLCGSAAYNVYEDTPLQRRISAWKLEFSFDPPSDRWWESLGSSQKLKRLPSPDKKRKSEENNLQSAGSNKIPKLDLPRSPPQIRPNLETVPINTPGGTNTPIPVNTQTPYIEQREVQQEPSKLGSGGFGSVFKGKYQFQNVAIKYPHYDGSLPQSVLEDLLQEVRVMQTLDHPNLVRFYGILVESKSNPVPKALVMELGSRGSLYDFLRKKSSITWPTKLKIAKDLATGLAYLHCSKSIIHQDIKSLNVVLNEHTVAKWCDFGLAKLRLHTATHSKGENTTTAGSLRWMSPERFKPSGKASFASDVWALGMVFFEIVSGEIPYSSTNDDALVRSWITSGETDDIPDECTKNYPKFAQVIKSCWGKDPASRPIAETVLQQMERICN